ncbi:UDP-N-acetylglucosamine transporter [Taenia crassiceps]|uniref:UDP-N-acetylglucosamine transporter n=1 Tax=Taenia crassiceps TaxID=6207 RepID=A0ABR4QQ94_9CEST
MPGSKCAKIGYLVVLSFQNVLHTLAMRYSRAEHRIRYSVSSVVILSLFKRAISGIYYDTYDFLRTCVPALIYVVQNNVIIFSLSCLDATVFQVVLFIGVAVVQLQDHMVQSSVLTSHDASGTAGLLAVLSASVLSGFAAVYFEKILKHSPKSLWTRNFELSLASIAIALVGQAVGEGGRVSKKGFFYGFDWLVWTTVALQSAGGILVALVVKHADNILKGFACSASIVITCIVSFVFFNSSLSWTFLFGTTCVVLAVFLYSLFPVPHF